MTTANSGPDLTKVERIAFDSSPKSDEPEVPDYLLEARSFLRFFKWCKEIREEYVGIFIDGVVGVFLFRITPSRADVDEWIWVIVGDIPPAYLTCESCPNPATALDGYIGAMSEWVEAADVGASVAKLIPVNVPATRENAKMLRKRLAFLNDRVLDKYRQDL